MVFGISSKVEKSKSFSHYTFGYIIGARAIEIMHATLMAHVQFLCVAYVIIRFDLFTNIYSHLYPNSIIHLSFSLYAWYSHRNHWSFNYFLSQPTNWFSPRIWRCEDCMLPFWYVKMTSFSYHAKSYLDLFQMNFNT